MHTYTDIYIYIYIYSERYYDMYICIYAYVCLSLSLSLFLSLSLYIYIYAYTHIDTFMYYTHIPYISLQGVDAKDFCAAVLCTPVMCVYIHIYTYIYIYIHTHTHALINDNHIINSSSAARNQAMSQLHVIEPASSTANPPTNIMDFRGFDSGTILILRVGILMSMGNFPESLTQAILAGVC